MSVDREILRIQKGVNIVSQKYKKIFEYHVPTFREIISQKGMYVELRFEKLTLKDSIGTVEAKMEYEFKDGKLKCLTYSFKFFSEVDKVTITTEGQKPKSRKYGFRFEMDEEHKGWGHPLRHMQLEYSAKPRFNHARSSGEPMDEVWAYADFLTHIQETYCKKDTFEIEYRSILSTH